MARGKDQGAEAFLSELGQELEHGGGGGGRRDSKTDTLQSEYGQTDRRRRYYDADDDNDNDDGDSREYPSQRRRVIDNRDTHDHRRANWRHSHRGEGSNRDHRDDFYNSRRSRYNRDYESDHYYSHRRDDRHQSPQRYDRYDLEIYDDHRNHHWRDEVSREVDILGRRSPTPPGTRPISERVRKNSKWDIAPPGYENISATQAKATGLFGIPGQTRILGVPIAAVARDDNGNLVAPPSMAQQGGSMNGSSGANTTSVTAASTTGNATQSNRQARRLYVGNIGLDATEASLSAFFNEQMRKLQFATDESGDPVLSVQVNAEKGYAFVEFRSVEETTKAMSFDGVALGSQGIKIRRPKDYVGPDMHPPAQVHVPGVISTNVPDGPNKIYIGALPNYLNEEQIVELLKSFGELRSFNLVRESGANGTSKGFAFCEYLDPTITDLAIQGLHDMELGEKRLIVQRASAGGNKSTQQNAPPSAAMTGANATAIQWKADDGLSSSTAMQVGLPNSPGKATRAMMLLNCVTAEELIDAEEYQEIVEDMRDECGKYGTVMDMRIPRPQTASKGVAAQSWANEKQYKTGSEEREGVGRVYVLFDEATSCQRALEAIAGRQFAGRTVIAAYISEETFPANEDGGKNANETIQQAQAQIQA